jgi:hypothetical protein
VNQGVVGGGRSNVVEIGEINGALSCIRHRPADLEQVEDEREGGNRDKEEKGMKGEGTIPENNMEIAHGGAGIGNKNREIVGLSEIDEEDHSGRGKKKKNRR